MWINGSRQQLKAAFGHGWEGFRKPAAELEIPEHKWPCATVTIDQGSDGFAACHYLMYKEGVVMQLVPDHHHRVWT